MGALSGWVCLVTGASRGIGKGIAVQLGEAGATVYITGRNSLTLGETAGEVEARGGACVPVTCDSSKDDEIRSLFERIGREQKGRLDILVNNAFGGVQTYFDNLGKTFWEMPPSVWDDMNNVGLRGHYICSVYAARMMVQAGRGLIVIISSTGGLWYDFNVPYGVGKAACDRLACDGAVELRGAGVAMVSLWPGAVRTETVLENVLSRDPGSKAEEEVSVSVCLYKKLMSLSGKVLLTCDLSRRYNLRDLDGTRKVILHLSRFLVSRVPGLSWLSSFIPSFLRVPKFVLTLRASKF
ncbi:dehydrogenase/reductase SDR family member 1 [Acipenser oxyrinchus oxyrinchus]|uniref:Dehydrogenase/reductase SDR family member 1 n=1 Tax=Acipenser oxyrinchus oxyrinchus TaxID=40147 RepID=A0AAD8CL18_ACIOX|nr:dehydrogenase/reductase SDR family member 1 [Acipenser oxyrinchus oxyrinchus]